MDCFNKKILALYFGLFLLFTGKLYAETNEPAIEYLPIDTETKAEPINNHLHDIGYFSVSAFYETGGNRSGLELSVIDVDNKTWGFKVSGVLYEGKSISGIKDLFAGYSFTPFLHLNKNMSPYIGAGIFAGDTFNCTDEEEKNGTCKEDTVIALYPEVGFILKDNSIYLSLFIRRYLDTNDSATTINANGFCFGFKF